jgi:hypothetical protein
MIITALVFFLGGCVSTDTRPGSAASPLPSPSPPALWAAEAIGQIHSVFYLPDQHLYGEEVGPGRGRPRPAFVWPSSIMLSALAAAAERDRSTYLPVLRRYIDALRPYRTNLNGLTGLDVWPAPKTPDRYYDDNAWMALALAEAWRVTHDPRDLAFAEESLHFTLTGEDAKLGGGIYWHEGRPDKKHTVSTAPAICAAILLFQATRQAALLESSKRLYAWTASHLREPDGLYADSIAVADGAIDHAAYAYNTGAMIRAACLLYGATNDPEYLHDAERSASAGENRWARKDGAFRDEAPMALKLAEAFVSLYEIDHDRHRLDVATRAIEYVHTHCRDPNGWYSKRWDDDDVAALDPVRLIDQAGAARAFWLLARTR